MLCNEVKKYRHGALVLTEDNVVKEPRSRSIVMVLYRRSCCRANEVKKYRHGVLTEDDVL